MHRATNYSGSTLLIVLCIMSLLFLLAHNTQLNSIFTHDVSLRAIQSEQIYYANAGLLNYALTNVLNSLWDGSNFGAGQWEFEIDQWPTAQDNSYSGKLHINSAEHKVEIKSQLLRDQKIVHNLSCNIEKDTSAKNMLILTIL